MSKKSVPSDLRILEASADCAVDIQAAGEEGKPKTFKMLAYTGGKLDLFGFFLPVVVDLAGMKVSAKSRPILRDHSSSQIVGHTTNIDNNGGSLRVSGVISGENEHSKEVVKSSNSGFPWQSSIGAQATRMVRVDKGETVEVNGRKFTGPLLVARQSQLREVSFVALGADDNTNAKVAAQAANNQLEIEDMNFEEWLKANFDGVDFSEKQLETLKAQYETEEVETEASTVTATATVEPPKDDPVVAFRASMSDETLRIADIRTECEDHPKIAAQAIKEGWDVNKTKVAVMNAELPPPPESGSTDAPQHGAVIEAALCMSTGISEEDAGNQYDEKTMNAANDANGKIGLRTLLVEVIKAAGGHVHNGNIDNDMIRAAFRANQQLIEASSGFSTFSLSGILGNVANKHMLNSYNSVASVVHEFCGVASHNDFKTHTKYRLTGSGAYEPVGNSGELKHMSMSEESYTNSVDTEGAMLSLTRKDMINDDLGALIRIASLLGRQGALALQKAVYTLLLSNPGDFFHANNNNYIVGAATNLSIDGLTTAEQTFMDQVDSNGDPIMLSPAILLVPSSLKVIAEQIFNDLTVNETTTANKPKTTSNPHSGKFKPVASPYLNNAAYAGNSALAWYLFSNPADIAAIEIAYLRGKQNPTIESGEADFNTLGMEWRGYFDFGVAMQDTRAAVKSKGAA